MEQFKYYKIYNYLEILTSFLIKNLTLTIFKFPYEIKGAPFNNKTRYKQKRLNLVLSITVQMDGEKETAKDKAMKAVGKTASTTYKATITMVKVVFVLIIVYTYLVSLYIFLTSDREQFLTNIATISVGGFWAFFLGYFGWRMGQTIEVYLHTIKKKK